MSLRQRIVLALLLPAATAVLAAATAYWALNVSINASETVRELNTAQNAYRELTTALVDAETGERGYVITGESSFLEPYNNAQQRIEAAIQALSRFAAEHPAQETDAMRADEIERLYTQWRMAVAEPVIAARRRHPVVLQEIASNLLMWFHGFQGPDQSGVNAPAGAGALDTLESSLRRGARLAEAAPTAVAWREALNRLADYRRILQRPADAEGGAVPRETVAALGGKLVELVAATADAEESVVAPVRSGKGKALMDRIRILIGEEMRSSQTQLAELHARSQRAGFQAKVVVAIGIAVALVGGIAVSITLMIGLDRRLRRITDAAERIADGDLAQRLSVEGDDELALLTTGFNRMAEDLQQRYLQSELLDRFGQTLQACKDLEEAQRAAGRFGPRLFPGSSGALYLTSASRTMTEAAAHWGSKPERLVINPMDCWALREGRVHHYHAEGAEMPCAHLPRPRPAEALCAPLVSQGEALGFLYLAVAEQSGARLPERERKLAATVAEQLGLAFANLQLRESLRAQSIRDPLTKLFNRRYLEETLSREVERAKREDDALSLLLMDIDHFKQFNDNFGHDAGDAVLAGVGALLTRDVRASDVAARHGGEEFVLVLSGMDSHSAAERAEIIRSHVEELQVTYHRKSLGAVTVSTGVASFPEHAGTPNELLMIADRALYRAKREGRNRVCVAAPAGAARSGSSREVTSAPGRRA